MLSMMKNRRVVTDPVLDYDPKSARTSFKSAEDVAKYIDERHLAIPYVIDTHAHADHLTAMPFFKKRYGARTVTGSRWARCRGSFAISTISGRIFRWSDASSIFYSMKDKNSK